MGIWSCRMVFHNSGWFCCLQHGRHNCNNGHNASDNHAFVIDSCSNLWIVQFVDAVCGKILSWWWYHYSTSSASTLPIDVSWVANMHGVQLQLHWKKLHTFHFALSRSFRWPCYGVCGFHTEAVQTVLWMGTIYCRGCSGWTYGEWDESDHLLHDQVWKRRRVLLAPNKAMLCLPIISFPQRPRLILWTPAHHGRLHHLLVSLHCPWSYTTQSCHSRTDEKWR